MKELKRGENFPMSLENQQDIIGIGLGWDHPSGNSSFFDLDVSAFLLNKNGLIPDDNYFIYYRNPSSPNQEVIHSGDNRSGAGSGDDECLWIELNKVNAGIMDILFIVSIHEGQMKNQHFGLLSNAYIRAFRKSDNQEILRYNLHDDLKFFDTGEFGRLSRKGNEWVFHATGQGEQGGLINMVTMFSEKR